MRHLTWLFCVVLVGCSPADDSGPTEADTDTDTDTDTDSDTDTDTEGPCLERVVTFEPTNGGAQDVTSFFETGEYLTLGIPGTLSVCPGTWFSRVKVHPNQ